MGLLDKLKDIIKIDINSPIVSINFTNSFNKTDSRQVHQYVPASGELSINQDALNEKQKLAIKDISREFLDEGGILFRSETSKLYSEVKTFNEAAGKNQVLRFFKPIIPPLDYDALEASFFLREQFQTRGDVHKLKVDIIKRFGERGKNIANLCTAGHFDGFLIQLYNEAPEKFKELYEGIIANSVLAVFVHSSMTEMDIRADIEKKITASKKYGLKSIFVHGIGHANVGKVKGIIETTKDGKYVEKRSIEGENIISVELIL